MVVFGAEKGLQAGLCVDQALHKRKRDVCTMGRERKDVHVDSRQSNTVRPGTYRSA